MTTYETILAEPQARVLRITLNRPNAMNAINRKMAAELVDAVTAADRDDSVGCILLTGSEKYFAAGADIKEMLGLDFASVQRLDWFAEWEAFTAVRKPIVAAVSGYALGGGCELAMMCDFILAADTAQFGQPEVKLGVMPGMGGSQRLTRLVGRAKAMEMCLTGRMMDAAEAERAGLVSRVLPAGQLSAEAFAVAQAIAAMPLLAVLSIKEAIRQTSQMGLAEGVRHERQLFHALFATEDQREGMAAFIAKRPAHFVHR